MTEWLWWAAGVQPGSTHDRCIVRSLISTKFPPSLKNVIPDRLGSRPLCLSFANLSVVEFTFFPPVFPSLLLLEIIKIMVYQRLKGDLISRFYYDH